MHEAALIVRCPLPLVSKEFNCQFASAYQYFANKAAILGALQARHADPAMHRILLTTLPRSARDARASDRPGELAALLGAKIRSIAKPDMSLFIARHALLDVIDEAVCAR